MLVWKVQFDRAGRPEIEYLYGPQHDEYVVTGVGDGSLKEIRQAIAQSTVALAYQAMSPDDWIIRSASYLGNSINTISPRNAPQS